MHVIYHLYLYLVTIYTYSYGYSYYGCIQGYVKHRVLPYNTLGLLNMTNRFCRNHCCSPSTYTYFGTENGYVCYCGDNSTPFDKRPDNECNKKCAGNLSEYCGGHWRLSIYEALCPSTENQQETTESIERIKEPADCFCPCRRKANQDGIKLMVQLLKEELTINKKNTSIYRRTKMSIGDDRKSSKFIGVVGVVIILLPVSLVVVNDLYNYFK